MALSVMAAFAQFLHAHGYTTSMWEVGYTADDVNQVCHELTTWAQSELQLPGEFLILWSKLEGTRFSGDNELVYAVDGQAYLVPNPFIEGDSEGFITAVNRIVHGGLAELYVVPMQARILYNAV